MPLGDGTDLDKRPQQGNMGDELACAMPAAECCRAERGGSRMPRRYRSSDEDSARWSGFELRDGDLVVSTRSKHGTTWMQTILLLLIHGRPPLPAPLGELSPWLDHLVEPLEDVAERLAAQSHRRVIKTHTPLDGIPISPIATYLVVARNPLDAAVSLYHQGNNLDRQRLRELTGADHREPATPRPPLQAWLSAWIDRVEDPFEALDSLAGVMHHLSDAWGRRNDPNVVLVHFDDLRGDLGGQMRHLVTRLGLDRFAHEMSELVAAASIDAMRQRATELAPDPQGILLDPRAFFRQGISGAGSTVASRSDLARYRRRVGELAPPDLLAWLHR